MYSFTYQRGSVLCGISHIFTRTAHVLMKIYHVERILQKPRDQLHVKIDEKPGKHYWYFNISIINLRFLHQSLFTWRQYLHYIQFYVPTRIGFVWNIAHFHTHSTCFDQNISCAAHLAKTPRPASSKSVSNPSNIVNFISCGAHFAKTSRPASCKNRWTNQENIDISILPS